MVFSILLTAFDLEYITNMQYENWSRITNHSQINAFLAKRGMFRLPMSFYPMSQDYDTRKLSGQKYKIELLQMFMKKFSGRHLP